jgi:hypothetical protein
MSGWWFEPTPLKNMLVSWGYDIPNIWKKQFQTTSQIYVLPSLWLGLTLDLQDDHPIRAMAQNNAMTA